MKLNVTLFYQKTIKISVQDPYKTTINDIKQQLVKHLVIPTHHFELLYKNQALVPDDKCLAACDFDTDSAAVVGLNVRFVCENSFNVNFDKLYPLQRHSS